MMLQGDELKRRKEIGDTYSLKNLDNKNKTIILSIIYNNKKMLRSSPKIIVLFVIINAFHLFYINALKPTAPIIASPNT